MSGRGKYLYRVVLDEVPAAAITCDPFGSGSRFVRHPDAQNVSYDPELSDTEECPSPLRVPEDLPAPIRDFQSLSPAMKLVDLYCRAGCKAHHEVSNEITWPTVTAEPAAEDMQQSIAEPEPDRFVHSSHTGHPFVSCAFRWPGGDGQTDLYCALRYGHKQPHTDQPPALRQDAVLLGATR